MAAVEHGGRDIEIMVVFDDDDDGCLLSETQKSNGLTRTFLFINTEQHKTISDLRSYIIDTLPLQNICPNDILLSINGFSLLPSEHTCKLNNKVIRCVKKTTTAPLPIDKFTGGCQSDIDRSEDDPKKRKATTLGDNQLSNKKKTNSPVAPQHAENDIHVKQNEHLDSPGSDELADGSTEINTFSLPPFEQTCSLNDKVISVTKTTAGGKLLPIDKVTRGCQSDIDRSEDPKMGKATTLGDNQLSNKKKTNCTTIEASPVAPQHVENDIHVKQNEPLDSPGSDESDLNWDECMEKLSEKSLGMSAGDVYLMRSTCCATGRHYGPMSILYHIRRTLLSGPQEGVAVVGIKILLDKVKDSLKGLQDVDVNYYESKSTETSMNDDPAVEPAVDAEGSKKSMDLDDTEGAQSFESIKPSGGALKFAQGIVAFCKLLSKERFHPLFLKDIEFHDLVLGIIDDIITADDLACAHQLFEDEYADRMLWEWSDDDEE